MASTSPKADTRAANAGVWLILVGLVSLTLGTVGLVLAFTLMTAGAIWYGGLLTTLGVVQFVHVIFDKDQQDRWIKALFGAVYLIAGLAITGYPVPPPIELTLVIGISLIVLGVSRALWAFTLAENPKMWVLLTALVSVILGLFIIFQAAFGDWALVFLTTDLVLYGVAAIALGFRHR